MCGLKSRARRNIVPRSARSAGNVVGGRRDEARAGRRLAFVLVTEILNRAYQYYGYRVVDAAAPAEARIRYS